MVFNLKSKYTRKEIHNALGGGDTSYLPSVKGQITCICLNPKLNPDAPRVILPGTGQQIEIKAECLCEQRNSLPTFIKRKVNEWEYMGEFFVKSFTMDKKEIQEIAKQSGRTDITRIIILSKT
jgi:hypothetical protein